jgi:flavin reductase (DIM6/NTAB) family NADH-FMN oxidoreductase RutF
MELEIQKLREAYRLIGHGPTVLVSTTDGNVPNACAVAWATPTSKEPPRFALRIGESHKTYKNLMATGSCVINIPTADAMDTVMICGRKSGNDSNKLSDAGIETLPSKQVQAPRLACCVAFLECKLIGELQLDGTSLTLVEAVLVEYKKGLMKDGHLDIEKHPTLHHLGGDRFSLPGSTRG